MPTVFQARDVSVLKDLSSASCKCETNSFLLAPHLWELLHRDEYLDTWSDWCIDTGDCAPCANLRPQLSVVFFQLCNTLGIITSGGKEESKTQCSQDELAQVVAFISRQSYAATVLPSPGLQLLVPLAVPGCSWGALDRRAEVLRGVAGNLHSQSARTGQTECGCCSLVDLSLNPNQQLPKLYARITRGQAPHQWNSRRNGINAVIGRRIRKKCCDRPVNLVRRVQARRFWICLSTSVASSTESAMVAE